MATLESKTAKGEPIEVNYPAQQREGTGVIVRCRLGKKSVLPAYSADTMNLMVEFKVGQKAILLLLSDVLSTSYWSKIHNAFDFFGNLQIDDDLKLPGDETARVIQWLKEQSLAMGVSVGANS